MADPIVVKVSGLTELTDLATGDLITVVDASEPVSANKTKKLQAGNIKLFTSAQLTDLIVTAAKIADNAVETAAIKDLNVTTGKLANLSVTAAKIANGTIATAKLADEAVTEAKLGAIKRMIMIPVFGLEDAVIVKNFTRIMAWHPDLDGHVITGAWAALLGHESSSGAVAMNLINAGGTMCSISISASGWSAQSGSIDTSLDDISSLATFSVNVTAKGTGAFGLTVYLEVTG